MNCICNTKNYLIATHTIAGYVCTIFFGDIQFEKLASVGQLSMDSYFGILYAEGIYWW